MDKVLIGCGQITWKDVAEDQVLAEIAETGYAGAPAAPVRSRTPEETLALFAAYGLRPAPGYLGADFWQPDQEEAILARAREYAHFAHAVGCTELYVAAGGFDTYITARGLSRRQISGHVRPEDGMSDAEYAQFARVLNQVGEITLAQGVRSCFHNHVGAVIETREEIDRLFELVDTGVVFMGPDTGHLAWAGVDVVKFCQDYARQIKTMHVKDIARLPLELGYAEEWDYGTYVKHGIFTELGTGVVDIPAVLSILDEAGFGGWLIVETDVTQLPTARQSAQASRDYLRTLGL
jgi:inosose dehydratase